MLSRTAVNGMDRESSKTGPRKRGLEWEIVGDAGFGLEGVEGIIKS
jgi:hypothetical protein